MICRYAYRVLVHRRCWYQFTARAMILRPCCIPLHPVFRNQPYTYSAVTVLYLLFL